MRALIALTAKSVAAVAAVVVLVGLVGASVRLLPWLVAPAVPWRLALPFARGLLSAVVEAAVLLGLPIGAAMGAAVFVERGEARAMLALGVRPARMVLALAGPGLLVIPFWAGVAALEGAPGSPGRLAAHLVEAGRALCSRSEHRVVDVPLLSVTWLCLKGGPRLAGRVPGAGGGLWFSAGSLDTAEDLRSFVLERVHLAGRFDGQPVRIRAREVRVRGLPSFGEGARGLSGALRGAVLAASALMSGLCTAWLVVRAGSRLLAAVAVAAAAAITMLVVLHATDARSMPPFAYAVLPISGMLAAVAASGLLAPQWRVAWRRAG